MTTGFAPVAFTLADATAAYFAWGANCGPAALAAMLGLSLEAVRPRIPCFEQRRYTNPTMMTAALTNLDAPFTLTVGKERGVGIEWPFIGLARIQWEGSWMQPGVPVGAQYARTHWVGVHTTARGAAMPWRRIFDINCLNVGGWVSLGDWSSHVVPYIWRECGIKATGWHVTHAIELHQRSA